MHMAKTGKRALQSGVWCGWWRPFHGTFHNLWARRSIMERGQKYPPPLVWTGTARVQNTLRFAVLYLAKLLGTPKSSTKVVRNAWKLAG